MDALSLAMLDQAGGADVETQADLLRMASRGLTAPQVVRRWIEVAAEQRHPELLEAMVHHLERLDLGQIPDPDALVGMLADRLSDAPRAALRLLGRLAVMSPRAVDVLMRAYETQSTRPARRQIVVALCRFEVPPGPVAAFLVSVLTKLDDDLRTLALDRLLRDEGTAPVPRSAGGSPAHVMRVTWAGGPPALRGTGRSHSGGRAPLPLEHLLDAAQPAVIKIQVLEFMADRSIPPGESVYRILQSDPSEACRLAAVRCLTQVPQALSTALQHEKSDAVCVELVQALSRTSNPAPALVAALKHARSIETTTALLRVLKPHLSEAREALFELLSGPVQASVARTVCHMLGPLLADDAPLLDRLVLAYDAAQDDTVKAAILEALTGWSLADERLVAMYERALRSPGRSLKNWGVQGMLTMPMSPQAAPRLAVAAPALLDRDVQPELKRALARKLTRIVTPPQSLLAAFKDVVLRATDPDLKDMCQKALLRTPQDVDFETWLRRVQVEHDVRGVFPDVYLAWDRDPQAAFTIIKTALLDERCRDSMYTCRVWDIQMMQFLIVKGRFDDDMSRYCVHRAVNVDGNASHLAQLKANPAYPDLKQAVRELMGSSRMRNWNTVLMKELLVMAWGSDAAAAAELQARLLQCATPAAAFPILHVLCDRNIMWEPTLSLLKTAMEMEPILDKTNRELLSNAFGRMHRDDLKERMQAPAARRKPGLADDDD